MGDKQFAEQICTSLCGCWMALMFKRAHLTEFSLLGSHLRRERIKVSCSLASPVSSSPCLSFIYNLHHVHDHYSRLSSVNWTPFFFNTESQSCCPVWRAIAQSWLPATYTCRVQVILLPQSPKVLEFPAWATIPGPAGNKSWAYWWLHLLGTTKVYHWNAYKQLLYSKISLFHT